MLRFDTGLIGVTAEHVMAAFDDAARERPATICLLRTAHIDIAGSRIDRDAELDIATFKVTENQLIESEAVAIDCRSEWPPPTPDRGRELSVAGFPQELATVSRPQSTRFNAFASLCRVEDVTERDIITTYEPHRDFRARAAPQLPDLGANLSGCSGGPVLMHVLRNGTSPMVRGGTHGARAAGDLECRAAGI